MRNVLSSRLKIHFKYNVKVKEQKFFSNTKLNVFFLQGSTVDRSATDKEKLNPCPTLKDNDFLETKRIIELGSGQKQIFMERLKRDVNVENQTFF